MSPTLRSSTVNSPKVIPTKGSESSTPTPSPRKVPTCTKCGRPRAGHPRSGCPYIDSASNEHRAPTPPNGIVDALGSMHIDFPSRGRDEETKAVIRGRHQTRIVSSQTLLSLSPSSQDIVEKLLQPGLLDDDDNNNTGARVVQWQEALHAAVSPSKSKPRIKMPGSLFDPSPESSQATMRGGGDKQESLPVPEALLSHSSSSSLTAQPIVRSMSIKERDMFVSNLSQSSDATVYVVPADDVHNLQASAIKIGFYARVVASKDRADPQALLVLGRDEKSVKRLFETVEVERKKAPSGRLGAVAGAAMVGAVSVWAGLAFS